jgi:hypothetical protein
VRRISILLIAVFAFSGLALSSGVAGASTTATKSSTASCAALVKKFDGISGVNPSSTKNPKNLGKVFGRASSAFKSMGKSAPPKLKASFNRLAKAYGSLKNIDFSNPSSVSKLTAFSSSIGKDLGKIGKYFANACKS